MPRHLILILAVGLLMGTGCATSRLRSEGTRAFQAGRYEVAAEKLESVILLKPRDGESRRLLGECRIKLADQAILAMNALSAEENVPSVDQALETGKRLRIETERTIQCIRDIESDPKQGPIVASTLRHLVESVEKLDRAATQLSAQKSRLIAEAEAFVKTAQDLAAVKNYEDARVSLARARAVHPKMTAVEEGERFCGLMVRMKLAFERGDFENAYRTGQEQAPSGWNDQDWQSWRANSAKRLGADLISRARREAAESDFETAINLARRAQSVDAAEPEYGAVVGQWRHEWAVKVHGESLKLAEQKQWDAAVAAVQRALAILPGAPFAVESESRIRQEAATFYRRMAERCADQNKSGAAWLCATRAREFLASDDVEKIRNEHAALIRKQAVVRLAWAGFAAASPAGLEAAAKIDALILRSLMASPSATRGQLQVLEREQLKKYMDEIRLSTTDLADPDTVPRLRALVIADVYAFGKLNAFEAEEQIESQRTDTRTYTEFTEQRYSTITVPLYQNGQVNYISVPNVQTVNHPGTCIYETINWVSFSRLESSIRLVDVATGQIMADMPEFRKGLESKCQEVRINSGNAGKAGVRPRAKQLTPPSRLGDLLVQECAATLAARGQEIFDILRLYDSRLRWFREQKMTLDAADTAGRIAVVNPGAQVPVAEFCRMMETEGI